MKDGLQIFNVSTPATDTAIDLSHTTVVDFTNIDVLAEDLKPNQFYKNGKLHNESIGELLTKRDEFFPDISKVFSADDKQIKKWKRYIEDDYKRHKISQNLRKALLNIIDGSRLNFLAHEAIEKFDHEAAEKYFEELREIDQKNIRINDQLIISKLILGKDQEVAEVCRWQRSLLADSKNEFHDDFQKNVEAAELTLESEARDNLVNLTKDRSSRASKLISEVTDVVNEVGSTLSDPIIKQINRSFDALKSGQIQKGVRLLQYATSACWDHDACKIVQLRLTVSFLQDIQNSEHSSANTILFDTKIIAERLHKIYPKNEMILTALTKIVITLKQLDLFMEYGAKLAALNEIKTADGFFYRGMYLGNIHDRKSFEDLRTAYDLYPDNKVFASAIELFENKFVEKNPSPVKKPEVIKENKSIPTYETIEIPTGWYLMAGTGVGVLLIFLYLYRKHQRIQAYKAQEAEYKLTLEQMSKLTTDFATGEWSYENGDFVLKLDFEKNLSSKNLDSSSDYSRHETFTVDPLKAKANLKEACVTLHGRVNVVEEGNQIKIKAGASIAAQTVEEARKKILENLAKESIENKFVEEKQSLREKWRKCRDEVKKLTSKFEKLSDNIVELATSKESILRIKAITEADKNYQADKELKIAEAYYDNIINAIDRTIANHSYIEINKTTIESHLNKFKSVNFTKLAARIIKAKYNSELENFTKEITSYVHIQEEIQSCINSIEKRAEFSKESDKTIGDLIIEKNTALAAAKKELNIKVKEAERKTKEENEKKQKEEQEKRAQELKHEAEKEKRRQKKEQRKKEKAEKQEKDKEKNRQNQTSTTQEVTPTPQSGPTLFGFMPSEKQVSFNELMRDQILKIENRSKQQIDLDSEIEVMIVTRALLFNFLRISEAFRNKMHWHQSKIPDALRNGIMKNVFLPELKDLLSIANELVRGKEWVDKILKHTKTGKELNISELLAFLESSPLYDYYKKFNPNSVIQLLDEETCMQFIWKSMFDLTRTLKVIDHEAELQNYPDRNDAISHCVTTIGHCAEHLRKNYLTEYLELLKDENIKEIFERCMWVRMNAGHAPDSEIRTYAWKMKYYGEDLLKHPKFKIYADKLNVAIPKATLPDPIEELVIDLAKLNAKDKDHLQQLLAYEKLLDLETFSEFKTTLRETLKNACKKFGQTDGVLLQTILNNLFSLPVDINNFDNMTYCPFKFDSSKFELIIDRLKTLVAQQTTETPVVKL